MRFSYSLMFQSLNKEESYFAFGHLGGSVRKWTIETLRRYTRVHRASRRCPADCLCPDFVTSTEGFSCVRDVDLCLSVGVPSPKTVASSCIDDELSCYVLGGDALA